MQRCFRAMFLAVRFRSAATMIVAAVDVVGAVILMVATMEPSLYILIYKT